MGHVAGACPGDQVDGEREPDGGGDGGSGTDGRDLSSRASMGGKAWDTAPKSAL